MNNLDELIDCMKPLCYIFVLNSTICHVPKHLWTMEQISMPKHELMKMDSVDKHLFFILSTRIAISQSICSITCFPDQRTLHWLFPDWSGRKIMIGKHWSQRLTLLVMLWWAFFPKCVEMNLPYHIQCCCHTI